MRLLADCLKNFNDIAERKKRLMRKRKQVLAAVLAGMFVFSLTACGGSNTAARQTEGVQETENEVEISSKSEEV